MSAFVDLNISSVVEKRHSGVLFQRELGLREDEIKFRHIRRVVLESHEIVRRLCGERSQNFLNLLLLLQRQFPDLIVEIDDGSGLYKEGGTAGALIVDNALHLVLILRFNGNTVAVSAHSDNAVLKVWSQRHIYHFIELLMDPSARFADLPADSAKSRARLVRDLLLGKDAAEYLPGEAL